MTLRSLPARIARSLALVLLSLVAGSVLMVLIFRWLPVPVTSFMIQDPGPTAHDWVAWREISRQAPVAVIASEDQNFLEHGGFDYKAIGKAWTDRQRGRRLRGGSTITQQVAKNLFLWPGQSWLRKGLETWFTLWIEWLWPKQRILEVYLNSAEFGRGVWGVEAASQRYFRKRASRLNREEAAMLAAVLPNPKRFRVDRPSPYVLQRQAWILGQMSMLGGTRMLQRLEKTPAKK